MNIERKLEDLDRRLQALEKRHSGELVETRAGGFKSRESAELRAAEQAVAEAESAYEVAKVAAYATVPARVGVVMISREQQENSPEFAALEAAEKAVTKARVRRAKIQGNLFREAIEGESFTDRMARTVGLK